MQRIFVIVLGAVLAASFATTGYAQKKSYAGCLADLQKKGYSSRAAADWCTRHGYTN